MKTVFPVKTFGGEIPVPGDKSISQRIAILASLADGTSAVRGFLAGEDAMNTLNAMCALGASAGFSGDVLKITGTAGKLHVPGKILDMGNSGTGTRLLAGILAGQNFESILAGDASLSRRPMGRIQKPLEQMGAAISLTGAKGTLPMKISGAPLHGIYYELPVASAQVKSCILLAGLFAAGRTTVVEPRSTRDHTEKLFEMFGLPIEIDGHSISISGGAGFEARELFVPGDFSSAAFWIAAAAARPGAELTVTGVGLNPRRTALIDVLKRMGAEITVEFTATYKDPVGTVVVRGTKLSGTQVSGAEIPNLIDEIPVLAVTAALATGETVIRDAAELRVKESDRIAVMATHLRAFGVDVEEAPDGMKIAGGANIVAPEIPLASHGDHRIAMSMAILALFADAPVRIADTACIATSYPGFWQHLEQLGGKAL
ncbi:MAG: 3-phosphoshikimate 1-carboxyvinyltransferase [Kiritimatiellales bacterium]